MKSIPTGYNADGKPYYTGGPFYGPFGVTGLSNSNLVDDATDREALVNPHFVEATEAADGDKFTSEHHFAAYGKALCLSCHQRSSLALNPEFDGIPGITDGDQFLELCSTWTAMSDGVGDNYQDTATAPKCQRCHMEPLEEKDGEAVTVLHQWDQPDELFTLAEEPHLTKHFLPPVDDGTVGPVAEGYLNNHAFMGANTADFGTTKIKTGYGALYVTVTEYDGKPFEVFATIGKSGRSTTAKTEAIGRLVSLAWRSGIQARQAVKQMIGITCHKPAGFGDNRITSCADAVAKAIQVHMADHGETDLSHANNGGACPDCGGPVEHEGGCCVCHVCGFSECA